MTHENEINPPQMTWPFSAESPWRIKLSQHLDQVLAGITPYLAANLKKTAFALFDQREPQWNRDDQPEALHYAETMVEIKRTLQDQLEREDRGLPSITTLNEALGVNMEGNILTAIDLDRALMSLKESNSVAYQALILNLTLEYTLQETATLLGTSMNQVRYAVDKGKAAILDHFENSARVSQAT